MSTQASIFGEPFRYNLFTCICYGAFATHTCRYPVGGVGTAAAIWQAVPYLAFNMSVVSPNDYTALTNTRIRVCTCTCIVNTCMCI